MPEMLSEIIGKIVLVSIAAGLLLTCAELVWYRMEAVRYRRQSAAGTAKGAPDDASGETETSELEKCGKRIAVITGASGGLGRAFSSQLDRKAGELDEIWLIGRREEALRETAAGLVHPARVLVLDLTDPQRIGETVLLMREEKVQVRYLINCAGFGKMGGPLEIPRELQQGMISLNCSASVGFTEACLPFMGRGSRIVNICSTAAFQPLQKLNVYAASKAFLLRYSRALRMELLPRGIQVTAVCPYWIRDTAFIGEAEETGRGVVRSYPLASRSAAVAAVSMPLIRLGLPVVTPGVVCTVHRIFSALMPDSVLQYIWELLRKA